MNKQLTSIFVLLGCCLIACQFNASKDKKNNIEVTSGYTKPSSELPDTAILIAASITSESLIEREKKNIVLPTKKKLPSLKSKHSTKNNYDKHEQTIKEILTNLIEARGIKPPKGIPKIVIDSAIGNSPAAALLDKQELHIHPKTIKICQNFGEYSKDALATIVGHELIHFYQQGLCAFSQPSPQVDSIENEADLQGLFNAYLAGYRIKGKDSTTIQMRLVDSIYQAFELENEMYGYPSKTTRQNMVKKAAKQVGEYRMLFDAANYAMFRGSFQISIDIYEHLLGIMDAKELNQNISIAYASFYKQLCDDSYTYPFEINTDFRLYYPIRADKTGINPSKIKEKALNHYCKAADNTDELLLFEASLAIIENDFPKAKIKLEKIFNKDKTPNYQQVGNVLKLKEKGEKPQKSLSSTSLIDACNKNEVLLDFVYPSRPIKENFLVYLNAKEGVAAINSSNKIFKMHRYRPSCLIDPTFQADYSLAHSNGKFHIFTAQNLILKEENDKIVEAVHVYPAFRR